ncbi:hypothetical protein [Nocardia mexicana]|uniref:hypothetical protein n=1 Tax=Nocardia mexicana TaxID=279262 RepID=UPI0011C06F33|nr:hypothetical protein [Nocardia mexicana]
MRQPLKTMPGIARWLRRNWRHHRDSGSGAADFVILSDWKRGPAAASEGSFMVSLTQYTPLRMADSLDIWRLSETLCDQLTTIDGAVAVMTYVQPFRRRLGSVSVWTDKRGLTKFIALPDHVETMDKYRDRGLPLRSATWWSEDRPGDAALTRGLRMLASTAQRRVRETRPGAS